MVGEKCQECDGLCGCRFPVVLAGFEVVGLDTIPGTKIPAKIKTSRKGGIRMGRKARHTVKAVTTMPA